MKFLNTLSGRRVMRTSESYELTYVVWIKHLILRPHVKLSLIKEENTHW